MSNEKQKPTSDAYRENWERIFGKKDDTPARLTTTLDKETYNLVIKGEGKREE